MRLLLVTKETSHVCYFITHIIKAKHANNYGQLFHPRYYKTILMFLVSILLCLRGSCTLLSKITTNLHPLVVRILLFGILRIIHWVKRCCNIHMSKQLTGLSINGNGKRAGNEFTSLERTYINTSWNNPSS